jgi:FAD/FMN-containing dehydrogenase
MTRDLVLGVEAVLPDGRIYAGLKSLRKDNTGYDLRSLFIGSEGTLGLITAASLKLWPRQRTSATAFAAIPTVAAAVQLLGMLRAAAADRLSSFELLPRIAVDLTTRHIPNVTDPFTRRYDWYILCELTSAADEPLDEILQETLGAAIERSVVLDAALSSSERQRQAFWRLREHIPEAQRLAGPSLKHDISVPVAALPRFVAEASAAMAVQAPDGVLVCYGHAGDGNLHFNISHLDDANNAGFLARESLIRRTVHDLVASYQGSISAEHGIGRLKREELQRYGSPVGLDCMRAIKRALDPNGIMNPGKLL